MWLDRWYRHADLPRWFGQFKLLFYLCALVIVASLILGGGARSGYLSDAILQLLGIPLLVVSLWRMFEVPLTKPMRRALLFCLTIAAIPVAQLIPLPPWLWTALPNREVSEAAFAMLGHKASWMPISVSPYQNVAKCAIPPPATCGLLGRPPAFLSRTTLVEPDYSCGWSAQRLRCFDTGRPRGWRSSGIFRE